MSPQFLVRLAVVVAESTTIAITWPLWQARAAPALLPLLELPPLGFAWPLLACLLLALRWPMAGAGLHTLVLALAMLADQTREQPQMVSFAILLWACTPRHGATALGVLHLGALWFWSGIGKLTSPHFLGDGGAWLLGADGPGFVSTLLAVALGLAEVGLAITCLSVRWRPHAAIAAGLLHAGMLVFLVFVRDANPAVWPWNAPLALAAPVLLRAAPARPWSVPGALAPRIAAIACIVLPLGYHAGVVDAPFAMQVYTMNEPRAVRLHGDGRREPVLYLTELAVPLPPVPRIQRQWFEHTARAGEHLALLERRPLARWLGNRDALLRRQR